MTPDNPPPVFGRTITARRAPLGFVSDQSCFGVSHSLFTSASVSFTSLSPPCRRGPPGSFTLCDRYVAPGCFLYPDLQCEIGFSFWIGCFRALTSVMPMTGPSGLPPTSLRDAASVPRFATPALLRPGSATPTFRRAIGQFICFSIRRADLVWSCATHRSLVINLHGIIRLGDFFEHGDVAGFAVQRFVKTLERVCCIATIAQFCAFSQQLSTIDGAGDATVTGCGTRWLRCCRCGDCRNGRKLRVVPRLSRLPAPAFASADPTDIIEGGSEDFRHRQNHNASRARH